MRGDVEVMVAGRTDGAAGFSLTASASWHQRSCENEFREFQLRLLTSAN
jgi:hypothetical protein